MKEYEKAMQIELAEKEAKYKEMDEAIEEAADVELSEEANEEDDGDLLYRDAEDGAIPDGLDQAGFYSTVESALEH